MNKKNKNVMRRLDPLSLRDDANKKCRNENLCICTVTAEQHYFVAFYAKRHFYRVRRNPCL